MTCDGSSAGRIPSDRDSARNPAIASSSVADVYSARPLSFSHECSGPTPG